MSKDGIIVDNPWLINLREPKEIKSELGGVDNIRWIMSTQENSDESTIYIVDTNGTHAIGADGKEQPMEVDNDPCSCEEYRKQGIEEGWIEE